MAPTHFPASKTVPKPHYLHELSPEFKHPEKSLTHLPFTKA